jgi:hypothetical protein
MKTSHVGSPQCSQRALEGAVNEFKFTHGGNLTSEGRAESAVVNGRFTLSTGGRFEDAGVVTGSSGMPLASRKMVMTAEAVKVVNSRASEFNPNP